MLETTWQFFRQHKLQVCTATVYKYTMVNETLLQLANQAVNGRRVSKKDFHSHIEDLDLATKLESMNPRQFAWHLVNNTWQIPHCPTCGNAVRFNTNRTAYAKYCCQKCGFQDPQRQQKIQNTMKLKYGVINAAHSSEIQTRKKKTVQHRYGVDHVSQAAVVKTKKQVTMQKNWGVDNPSQSSVIQQRKIQTNQEKYGVDWAPQAEEIRNKQKQTSLKNWGHECSLMNPEIQSRRAATMLDKYGVLYPQQNSQIQQNTRQTNLDKWGVEWPTQCPEVKQRARATFLENHGVSHINYINKDPQSVEILHDETKFRSFVQGLTTRQAAEKLGFGIGAVLAKSKLYNCRSIMKGGEISLYEQQIVGILDELNITYNQHNRKLVAPREVDFYIPHSKIAIDVGSAYWHGERVNRNKNYHYQKWKTCYDQGITLFQWFDQDLFDHWHLTAARLKRALGQAVPVVGARKTQIVSPSVAQERQFLNQWHAKGFAANRNHVIGAEYQDQLVAVMTIKQQGHHAVIERWATDINRSWPGLFSRLLKYWIQSQNFQGKVSTWSDNRLGTGQVYASVGFQKERVSQPGYWYFQDWKLENRQKYQKHKLKKMFNLSHEHMQLSEWQIMQQQGYDRIWDAGHTLWSLSV